jgi:16S rRNA (adenine1518-N6/adenine1519-N6)-dimethyltransferase
MAQSKKEIQSHLETAGSQPRHRFGQNFMIDQNLVRLIAAAGEIVPGDVVIEVGPGTGTLTEELLATPASKVVAVEIDRDLAAMLRDKFAAEPRFELIEGDALAGKHELNEHLTRASGLLSFPSGEKEPNAAAAKVRALSRTSLPLSSGEREPGPRAIRLVANLPYNIASPLVIELLIAGVQTLAFTVQKEVADRLAAKAGEDAYGAISVMVQLLGDVEVLRTLPPQAFWPAPKIESALVRIRRRDRLGKAAVPFSRFLQQLFSARRKTIRKALSQADYDAEPILTALSVNPQARPETLDPQTLLAVFQRTC